MFDRLKNFFKKRATEELAAEPEAAAFPPREFQPGYTPGDRPAAEPPPFPEPAPFEGEPPQPAGDSIRILLKPVLLKLPDVLRARVRQPPSGPVPISIPLQKVLAQLPQGSVKISFGELRQASPAGVFVDMSDQDQTPVELPLPEIVAQIRPDQLPRRAAQRKLEVPDEVGGIFGPKGKPLTSVRMSSAAAKAPAASAPAAPAIAPRPVPAAPKAATPPAPAAQPAVPIRSASPLPPPPIKPVSPLPAASALKPAVPPPPHAPLIRPSQPLPGPTMKMPPAPARPSAPAAEVPEPAPEAPSAPVEPLVVPLAQLAAAWPDAIRQALAQLPDATVSLPSEELEQMLKRGRIQFPWKRIRSLIDPPLSADEAQALDETELGLPLPIIAPLFLARKKPAAPQRRYAIEEHIPDIFAGKGMTPSAEARVPAPAAPAAPPTSAAPPMPATSAAPPAPAPPVFRTPAPSAPSVPVRPAVAPAPVSHVAAAPGRPQEIGEVFGQPGRKNWTPSEIVQKTSALRGVAGALIAMQDGLLVAGHLPPGLNGETIAAFLPQMFSRVLQYTKELRFGESNSLTIIVENVPLKIFKVGGVFYTVLGRDGESLPEPHLSIVAAQLGPQNK